MLSVLVALAGGAGAGARFIVDGALTHRISARLPVATLIINVSGSFLLGVLTQWGLARGSTVVVAVLGVGFLGGFTTFSTASVELVGLARSQRPGAAVMLAVSMLVLSLTAAVIGMALIRSLLT
ncbi:MAG: CrcB family protein [Dermatophilaceae bacterium]|nr:CrcB family protein [Intrasporangiaceae bacterium]